VKPRSVATLEGTTAISALGVGTASAGDPVRSTSASVRREIT